MTKGECIPCNTSRCLSSQQIIAATTFESAQTKEKRIIHHKVSCKNNYVIYILECLLCKIKYIGKSETPFYIKLNNQKKDIKKPHAIEARKHFNNWTSMENSCYNWTIEQYKNTSIKDLKQRLEDKENYWIKRLKPLAPLGLNQELN